MMKIAAAVLAIMVAGAAAGAAPSAEQLFDEGEQAFDRGDYGTAIARYQASFDLSRLPLLVLNIAQAYRLSGACVRALSAYRQYVTLDPTSERRGFAEGFISELEPKCGARSSRDGALPASQEESTHPRRNLKFVGLAVSGAGAVSVATGLYFGHRATSLGEEVTNGCRSGCDWAVYGGKDAEGRRAETKQYVFAGIGAAAIIGGGVMYWLSSREQRPTSIAIAPGREGAAITWSGSW
jgi:hypothetical protein